MKREYDLERAVATCERLRETAHAALRHPVADAVRTALCVAASAAENLITAVAVERKKATAPREQAKGEK